MVWSKRKLAPRYVGPYPIIEKSGRVAYKIELPYEMRAIFNVSLRNVSAFQKKQFHLEISS